MSEKRFEMKGDTHIFDSKTSEEYYAPSEYGLVNLLNSLAEENEDLYKENDEKTHHLEKLVIENANLENSIKYLNNQLKESQETNLTLVKEIRKLPLTDKQFKEMNDKL